MAAARSFLSTLKAGLSRWQRPALKPLFSRAVRSVTWSAVRGCGCRCWTARRATTERLTVVVDLDEAAYCQPPVRSEPASESIVADVASGRLNIDQARKGQAPGRNKGGRRYVAPCRPRVLHMAALPCAGRPHRIRDDGRGSVAGNEHRLRPRKTGPRLPGERLRDRRMIADPSP
jgi:hypothetical protein